MRIRADRHYSSYDADTQTRFRSPVGSGKTALLLALCRAFRDEFNIGESGLCHYQSASVTYQRCRLVRSCRDQRHLHQGELTRPVSAVTSVDLLLTGPLASIHMTQQEDQEFLIRNNALEDQGRVRAVETGKQPTSVRSTVRTSY